jgi:LPS-assembly protein
MRLKWLGGFLMGVIIKKIIFCLLVILHPVYALANGTLTPKDEEIYIEYDQLHYSQDQDIIVFKGNVVIVKENETLLANEVHYNKKLSSYYALGNVVLTKADGNIYFADKINLNSTLYQGKGINLYGRFQEKGLLAASSFEMFNLDQMQLNNIVYSTCKICEDNVVPNTPLWQIRAKEAYLDRTKEAIYYKDASLEAFGHTILYTPYMSTPSPNAKSKSGLLFPVLKWTKDFGYSFKQPIYFRLAANKDAVIAPRFYSKKDPLFEGEFRHLLEKGEYQLRGSFTNTDKVLRDGTELKNKSKVRAHIEVNSYYRLDNNMFDTYLGFDAMRVYDKSRTYLKKYKINNDDTLTTNGYVRNFWDTNYIFFDSIYFQNLRPNANWHITPRVTPWLRSRYMKDLGLNMGSVTVESDILNLHREQGIGYQRYSSKVGYSLPMVLPYGQLFRVNATLRGDYYQVHQKPLPEDYKPISYDNHEYERNTARLLPELNFEWGVPMVNYTAMGTIILEPVVNIILSKERKPSKVIPNEDSQFFELSALNLFSSNRYLGYDQVETGSRINYGIRGNFKNNNIKSLGFTIGKVINFKENNYYSTASGLNGKHSNYVSKINLQPTDNTYISHQLRIDESDFSVMRSEVYAHLSLPKWSLALNYMEVGKKILEEEQKIYRKDLSTTFTYNIYDKWWLGVHGKRKFGKNIPGLSKKILEGMTLNYFGDCLHMFFTVERDHAELNDLIPSTNYSLNFQIPTF